MAVIDTKQGRSTLLAIHADHLGTPRVITDAEGKAVWSWSLHDDPFGENAPVSSSGYALHLRFAGQYYDPETGLHYNLQRYYDPTVGRYVTSDPLGLSAGANTYAYVAGSPLVYFDFLGLCAEGGVNLPPPIIRPDPLVTLKVEPTRPPIVRLKPSRPLLTKVDNALSKQLVGRLSGKWLKINKFDKLAANPAGVFILLLTHSPGLGGCQDGVCADEAPPPSQELRE